MAAGKRMRSAGSDTIFHKALHKTFRLDLCSRDSFAALM